MNLPKRTDRGFTLIELLVVITIIAILATVATPMMNKARMKARMIPATKNAQSILVALTAYSGESGGLYPESAESSNDALRQLFPHNCEDEKMFWQQGDSAFCSPDQPDNKIGEADGEFNGQALQPGENHWAYVSGLRDSDRAATPIVADGFTGQAPATYDNRRHIWAGTGSAIVGFIDGSAHAKKIHEGIVQKEDKSGGNLFDLEIMEDDPRIQILNPVPPARGSGEDV